MKKTYRILLILTAILAFALAACGKPGVQDKAMPSSEVQAQLSGEPASEEITETSDEPSSEELTQPAGEPASESAEAAILESDTPTGKDELAAYIHKFGRLPDNFITKKEAGKLGWSSGKDLWDSAYGYSIGGDRFGNIEGYLPDAPGREYRECDVGYEGGKRGAERIVYSNDGLIYYTADHYNTFELLYGEE